MTNQSRVLGIALAILTVIPGCGSSGSGSSPILAGLELSAGVLDPAFDPEHTEYKVSVGFLSRSLSITAGSNGSNAITINGVAAASGVASIPVELTEGGSSLIVIEVTTEDGETGEYKLEVQRDALQEFAQRAYVKASNTSAGDQFGNSVSVSGDTLAVGAPRESSNGVGVNGAAEANEDAGFSGAVYVFIRSDGLWSQQAYIKASNTGESDQFGTSVSVSGDTLAVGAPGEASNGVGVNGAAEANNDAASAGAVYVFTRSGDLWSQQAYVKASNTDGADRFGTSVSVSGDTLAVGAPGESSNGVGVNGVAEANNDVAFAGAGAVYVFTRSDGLWSQQAYVKASNTDGADLFGTSVSVSGDTLAVGAFGESSNGVGVNGVAEANNDVAFAGAGAVYVFTRSDGLWSQQAYVKASNTDGDDRFGTSVSVSGDTLAVGASGESSNGVGVNGAAEANNGAFFAGAVYVFTRSEGLWSQQAYVKASNTRGEEEQFGSSVSVSGDTLAVGAFGESSNGVGINGAAEANDDAAQAGAVYVFTRSGGSWSQQAYVKASNTDGADLFGTSVSVSGDTLAVGAPGESSNGVGVNGVAEANNDAANAGAVYVLR